jgi:hypothetical protein
MKIRCTVALIALLGSMPLQAATDAGLTLHNMNVGQRGSGVGTAVNLKLKLGSERIVRGSERLKLGIAAGPTLTMPNASSHHGIMRRQPTLVGIEFQPGYAASLNFGGKPVMTSYTHLGATENEKDGKDEGKQGTGDKVAWVALVGGGVMLALIGVYALSCGNGEDSSCGSD